MAGANKAATLLITLSIFFPAHAGTLAVAPPTVESNRYVFPISLEGAETGVASLDFQFRYDPEIFTPVSVETGAGAVAAGKLADGNLAAPGAYNVLVMGVNQNALPPGEVARIVLERNPGSGGSQSNVVVANPTLSSAQGDVLAASGSDRMVRLDGEAPEPDDRAEEDAETPETEEPEPDPSEAPAAPEESGDQMGEDLSRNVADALLVGLAQATPSETTEAKRGVPVSGEETPETVYSIRERRMPAEALPTVVAVPVQALDAERVESSDSKAAKVAESAAPVVAPEERPATPAVMNGGETTTPLTVEEEYSAMTPEADGNAQEGGRMQQPWQEILVVSGVVALIAAAVWWSRRRVTRL
ncbi:MAG: hypothetical protein RLZZ303_8 [Candidatus Hydrogenedentota bacterium]|jgi:hypothetical protein